MAEKLKDALDVRIIAHATGIDEVGRRVAIAVRALQDLQDAIDGINIELEVDN